MPAQSELQAERSSTTDTGADCSLWSSTINKWHYGDLDLRPSSSIDKSAKSPHRWFAFWHPAISAEAARGHLYYPALNTGTFVWYLVSHSSQGFGLWHTVDVTMLRVTVLKPQTIKQRHTISRVTLELLEDSNGWLWYLPRCSMRFAVDQPRLGFYCSYFQSRGLWKHLKLFLWFYSLWK